MRDCNGTRVLFVAAGAKGVGNGINLQGKPKFDRVLKPPHAVSTFDGGSAWEHGRRISRLPFCLRLLMFWLFGTAAPWSGKPGEVSRGSGSACCCSPV